MKALWKLAGFIMLAIIISICGSEWGYGQEVRPEEIKIKMMAYLKEKYGEEFVPLSLNGKDWVYSYDRLCACPKCCNRQPLSRYNPAG
ncbi:MAG: hypothetical protein E7L01_31755 [Paenibacillus macerans]|uniref:hypothetical protein n=1 Tax=Paenibacillus TaxID=44249 RepID=UPI0024308E09|nr:hypothetical protein [Paenibacillus macerans]MBS5914412.1 hypothetical protein [Paenibacillus macerans]MDU7477883.1 hypothetical protein [Paenibacillus macerans]